jgi:predicted lipoprotein with Yx(FWY)xxD motif
MAVTVVKTGTATVSGKPTTVLTNAAGMTLYYFAPDTPTKAACTASVITPTGKPCTVLWPPLLLAAGAPTSATSLPGKLTAVEDGNGRQVEYQGHPLYTFSEDTAPGQANGEGFGGKWFVAVPTLAPASATPASSSSSTSSTAAGGGGY